MSIYSQRRKQAIQARTPARLDPREDIEVRTARRICSMVYSHGCSCKGTTNGRPNCCDVMRHAAQAALDEILNGVPGV